MSNPPPPVAAVRVAVRRALADLPSGSTVLVACSGGADSLALAAATLFVAPRAGLAAGLVTVDHGLQPGSAAVAGRVAAWAAEAGFDPVETHTVAVRGGGGPEAAARAARYAALDATAAAHGGEHGATVLLGHTLDDQAETVLLGLARGSGARSLAGMAPVRGVYRRPFLGLSRQTTRDACDAFGLPVWADPHNDQPRYARVRARRMLDQLERALGPGVVASLARTARLLRADADLLDALAADRSAQVTGQDGSLDAVALAADPDAVRGRILRDWALAAGAQAGALTEAHVTALDALVTSWAGQGPVALPGGLHAARRGGRLRVAPGRVAQCGGDAAAHRGSR
jgi:tRNA(Ile)-lysidine synthase